MPIQAELEESRGCRKVVGESLIGQSARRRGHAQVNKPSTPALKIHTPEEDKGQEPGRAGAGKPTPAEIRGGERERGCIRQPRQGWVGIELPGEPSTAVWSLTAAAQAVRLSLGAGLGK